MPDSRVLLMRSRDLRRNMTREEKHLYYDGLKRLSWKFRRQMVIGNYIVDFCCPALRLIVEVDGTQHYLEQGRGYDEARDAWLERQGYKVLRYSNEEINCHFEAVCEDIFRACEVRGTRG